MELSRRAFFKVIAATSAAIAVPAFATTLIEATQPLPEGAVELGLIREIICYDINTDNYMVRHDIYEADGEQFHISHRTGWGKHCSKQLEGFRVAAKAHFERVMKDKCISWRDLRPLPVPDWYVKPSWVSG